MSQVLVRINSVSKDFVVGGGVFNPRKRLLSAVSNVTLEIQEGETLGLVGESGSGKTTLGRLILRLLPCTSGDIFFQDQDISNFNPHELKTFRTKAQIVFQDPFSSFDPRMRISETLSEGMPSVLDHTKRKNRINELLDIVGLPVNYVRRFPHQLSGGERQRVGVARALAVNPKFIVLDEPVSALDVSVQAQVLNLLKDLRSRLNLTLLMITHDLRVVKHMADRVAVMYLGQIMELGSKDQVYVAPLHPYTQALLSAIPALSRKEAELRRRIILNGEIPSSINVPPGCRFSSRCCFVQEECRQANPPLVEIQPGHWTACLLVSQGKIKLTTKNFH
jgi:oligopeptide transport system ATP-binding protein